MLFYTLQEIEAKVKTFIEENPIMSEYEAKLRYFEVSFTNIKSFVKALQWYLSNSQIPKYQKS